MDEMVRQAVIAGMTQEDAAGLEHELEAEFKVIDANSDGQISFEEFQSILGLMGKPDTKIDEAKAKIEDMVRKRASTTPNTGAGPSSVSADTSVQAAHNPSPLPAADKPGTPPVALAAVLAEESPEATFASSSNDDAIGESRPPSKSPTESNLVLLALSIRAKSMSRSQSRTLFQVNDGAHDIEGLPLKPKDSTESRGGNRVSSADDVTTSSPGRAASTSSSGRAPDPRAVLLTSPSLPRGASGLRTVSGGAVAAAAMTAAVAATVASQPMSGDGVQREAYFGRDHYMPSAYDTSEAEMDRLLRDDDGKELDPSSRHAVTKDELGVRFCDNPISSTSALLSSQLAASPASGPPGDVTPACSRSGSMQRSILKGSTSMTRLTNSVRGESLASFEISHQNGSDFDNLGCSNPKPDSEGRTASGRRSSPTDSEGRTASGRRSSPTDSTAVPIIIHG